MEFPAHFSFWTGGEAAEWQSSTLTLSLATYRQQRPCIIFLASCLHKYLTRKHNFLHVKMMLLWLSWRMEFKAWRRRESAPLSRQLSEHQVRTLPLAPGARIHHGVAFLIPHFPPQATKCARFYPLPELALWHVPGTLLSEPIYLLKTEGYGPRDL